MDLVKPVSSQEWASAIKTLNKYYAKWYFSDNQDELEGDLADWYGIIEREKERMINGCWCWINGDAVYIPGSYYFYLTYWSAKDKSPIEYIEANREEFLVFEAALKSQYFKGTITFQARQQGKSLMHTCKCFWLSYIFQGNCSIQSTGKQDIKRMFAGCLKPQMSNLPLTIIPHKKNDLARILGIKNVNDDEYDRRVSVLTCLYNGRTQNHMQELPLRVWKVVEKRQQ